MPRAKRRTADASLDEKNIIAKRLRSADVQQIEPPPLEKSLDMPIDFIDVVGTTGAARVFRVQYYGAIYALKVFKYFDMSMVPRQRLAQSGPYECETRAYMHLRDCEAISGFIPKYFWSINELSFRKYGALLHDFCRQGRGPAAILMEDCSGAVMSTPEHFSKQRAASFRAAFKCLHEHGVIHDSITPKNLRIFPDSTRVIISGFGGAQTFHDNKLPHWAQILLEREQECLKDFLELMLADVKRGYPYHTFPFYTENCLDRVPVKTLDWWKRIGPTVEPWDNPYRCRPRPPAQI